MAINISAARSFAESLAQATLRPFAPDRDRYLRDEYAEGEGCWFFFRDQSIQVPDDQALSGDWAYAVSKEGTVRQIPDYSHDQTKLSGYLDTMSQFFKNST